MEHLPLSTNNNRVYASFSKRFSAAVIDLLIFSPLIFLFNCLNTQSIVSDISLEILLCILPLTYTIYLNYMYGGTLGKLFEGIRISQIDGSRIKLSHALIRSSVDIFISITLAFLIISSLLTLDTELHDEYFKLTWLDREDFLLGPSTLHQTFSVMLIIWYLSELLIMLTNERRRALHDYLAGTVVINKEFSEYPK